jgi:hypothetical protein
MTSSSLCSCLSQLERFGQQISSSGGGHHIPTKGVTPIASLITDDSITIDCARPSEVFRGVFMKDRGKDPCGAGGVFVSTLLPIRVTR